MGCCFSSNRSPNPNPKPKPEPTRVARSSAKPRNLDPPVAEESVKEVVVSETPLAKPPLTPLQEEEKPKRPKPEPEVEASREIFSEVSMVSESCERDVSESFSYSTTTTVTEVKDDNDEAISKRRQREAGPARGRGHVSASAAAAARRKRPSSGELAARRGRGRGHVSPAGRFERSASKRNRSTETEAGRVAWRDPGEVSSRRSRSPATRQAAGRAGEEWGEAGRG